MAAFNREELKPQALLKAEEKRKNWLAALEAKIKSYRDNLDFVTPCIFFYCTFSQINKICFLINDLSGVFLFLFNPLSVL